MEIDLSDGLTVEVAAGDERLHEAVREVIEDFNDEESVARLSVNDMGFFFSVRVRESDAEELVARIKAEVPIAAFNIRH